MSNGRSTACIADLRTNSVPTLCACKISPANTPVISRASLSVTLNRKLGPAFNAMSRISSQSGLPSVDAESRVRIADVAEAVIAHHRFAAPRRPA